MFRKLKRKFVLTNLVTSTAIIVIAFAAIYFSAMGAASHRGVKPYEHLDQNPTQNPQSIDASHTDSSANQSNQDIAFNAAMDERIATERQEALNNLLISLIIIGLSVEVIVALISFYLAEQSIKPVREAYNAQKEFVANASHEIKTPLAVIQANLEAADIQGNKWLDNVAKKTEDLTNLNNQLLALARSESVSEEIHTENTDLSNLIDETISSFEPKAAKKDISINKTTKEENINIKLNRKALEQILNIYIDNAIKYGKKSVTITLSRDKIAVASDGNLIPADKIEHLFERFYQTDKTADGVGLGLAIAQSIAEKNHWKLSAYTTHRPNQNIFTIKFK